jgi:hypothetical protein
MRRRVDPANRGRRRVRFAVNNGRSRDIQIRKRQHCPCWTILLAIFVYTTVIGLVLLGLAYDFCSNLLFSLYNSTFRRARYDRSCISIARRVRRSSVLAITNELDSARFCCIERVGTSSKQFNAPSKYQSSTKKIHPHRRYRSSWASPEQPYRCCEILFAFCFGNFIILQIVVACLVALLVSDNSSPGRSARLSLVVPPPFWGRGVRA